MIQVENEIAVFGVDRHNPKMWRDHSVAANQRFAERGFTDDLKFSAWDLSYNWIRRITEAGSQEYPIPFFHNFVGGQIADWMVGGAPGEDVGTYLQNCPDISYLLGGAGPCFVGLPEPARDRHRRYNIQLRWLSSALGLSAHFGGNCASF